MFTDAESFLMAESKTKLMDGD